MSDRKKKSSRKTALLVGAVSGASLIMQLGSIETKAQSFSCETGGALQDSNAISGCTVISYGLTPPEEIGLAVPVQSPPATGVTADNGGIYSL